MARANLSDRSVVLTTFDDSDDDDQLLLEPSFRFFGPPSVFLPSLKKPIEKKNLTCQLAFFVLFRTLFKTFDNFILYRNRDTGMPFDSIGSIGVSS